jgi:tetratricopeptide (TPR) repeat protein
MSRRSKKPVRQVKAVTSSSDSVPARPAVPPAEKSWWGNGWLHGLVLIVATFIAYQKVLHAGFIWDDDAHVIRPFLRSVHGLWRIWFEPGATQQYYPFLYSAFWLEHRLWGDSALGYHLVNIVWHLIAAGLFYRILRRLAVPGAFLAASIFALHPVCVESVAWISEQKNTLSTVFYMLAALVYLRFDQQRRVGLYALSFGFFVLALMSKSVTATLPAALLVVFWWKRGQLSWRRDVLPLLPWFILGAGAGTLTAWMEQTHVGASGTAYGLSFAERFLVAGRAIWFYLGKIFWPVDLIFIYPRWTVNTRELWPFLFPAATLAALAALLALRGRSRGPLAVALLFTGTLFPALGFVNVFPFIYSYVADHFQYLAVAMMSAGLAAAFVFGTKRLSSTGRRAAQVTAVCLVGALAWLTWRQGEMYADKETLWRTTIARDPASWIAYNNLGGYLLQTGRVDEAIGNIQTALKFGPSNAAAYANLGNALWQKRQANDAIEQYKKALEIDPGYVPAHLNLGNVLLQTGHANEALASYQRALEIKPDFATAHTNLGDAFFQLDRTDEAIDQYNKALEDDPHDVEAHTNLGTISAQKGRMDQAIAHYQDALAINPSFAMAHTNLGNALLKTGRTEEAIPHYRKALEIKPDFAKAHTHLGDALLQIKHVDEAVAHYTQALKIDPRDVEAHTNLGTVLAQRGQMQDAVTHFQAALEINPDFAIAQTNLGHVLLQTGRIDEAIVHYRKALEIAPASTAAQRGLDFALSRKSQ